MIYLAIGLAIVIPLLVLLIWLIKGEPDWMEKDEHEKESIG